MKDKSHSVCVTFFLGRGLDRQYGVLFMTGDDKPLQAQFNWAYLCSKKKKKRRKEIWKEKKKHICTFTYTDWQSINWYIYTDDLTVEERFPYLQSDFPKKTFHFPQFRWKHAGSTVATTALLTPGSGGMSTSVMVFLYTSCSNKEQRFCPCAKHQSEEGRRERRLALWPDEWPRCLPFIAFIHRTLWGSQVDICNCNW